MPKPKTRSRVDDEEALIPRSDMEEFHTTTRKKMRGRCNCCCGLKCWFGMFLLLVIGCTALFYVIYPSVIHENLNKFMGFACTASGYAVKPNVTITCLVMTSSAGIPKNASAVSKTWTKDCKSTYYFYEGVPVNKLPNSFTVTDVTSLEPISIALNGSDATSWYLLADDSTYVVNHRVQRLLSNVTYTGPAYVGGSLTQDSVGTYLLNYKAASLLVNTTRAVKTEKLLDSIKANLNKTNCNIVDGFTLDNPASITNVSQMNVLSKAYTFRSVSPEQMYTFYVLNTE